MSNTEFYFHSSSQPYEQSRLMNHTGKSTVLSLLSKLYSVGDGEILLDDKNIESLSADAIRSNIGAVSQMPYMHISAEVWRQSLFLQHCKVMYQMWTG